ncbi:MAG: 50S ribosomal protein L17, partial [Bacteroidales bacterium]|nr:50S ribosomal protein L17 [Bacteroidales bacterium]
MRHKKKNNHLSRTAAHRSAMLSNMAASLIMHKRIFTTVPKAKALRRYVEPIITKSKEDTTNSRRMVFSMLQNKYAVAELFQSVSPKVSDRPGGYTRILKTGHRLGDNASMCFIELVDFNENMLSEGKTKKTRTRRSRRRSGGGAGAATAAAAATGTAAATDTAVKEAKSEEVKQAEKSAAKKPAAKAEAPEAEASLDTTVEPTVEAKPEAVVETPVEEAPAVEETPAVEEAPAVEETPVEESPVASDEASEDAPK